MNAPWLVAMDWRDALFVHWPVPAETLRARIPSNLELDVFGASAWIGIVAFRIAGARARGVPARLGLRSFGEINVRTYVTGGGTPGVWFLSLDAASALTVEGGRTALHLPYYRARIAIAWNGTTCAYDGERTDRRAAPARFAAGARITGNERHAQAGSLEHFLVERYCFYTVDRRGRTVRGDVLHPPWPLRDATVAIRENTLLAAVNVTPGAAAPLAHASAGVATRARNLVAR
ncbi:MAG TPA: DUF2071 domain-containing protein [Candidatus Elarobacter sp.]|nr:DUF2071 domain-containing protein [Candidatus Elarobacter sp.]